MEWNVNGKQPHKSAKSFSWETAREKARKIEKQYLDAELGKAPVPGVAKRLDGAIALFLDNKRGEDLSGNTLYKYKLTLDRLQTFCDLESIWPAKDITLAHLTSWRAKWSYDSPLAKRNNQARVKSFFKFLSDAGVIPTNPTSQLSGIQVKADEASDVHPLEPKEYQALIAAIPKSGLQPQDAIRVKACMQLQRWSGLSLVDAVCLSKDELIHEGKAFRVKTERSKTGLHINNVVTSWLGKDLLAAKNGNPEYFFISGEATPKGAVSVFEKMYRQVFDETGPAITHSPPHICC